MGEVLTSASRNTPVIMKDINQELGLEEASGLLLKQEQRKK